jgi:molecular chaperone GrpE
VGHEGGEGRMPGKHRKKDRDLNEERNVEAGAPEGAVEIGGGAGGPEGETEELRAALEDLNGKWLRALADLDNYRKRVERDRCRWSDAAREEVLLDLLDVVDNFERALACGDDPAPEAADPFREGVEMILKQLVDVLRKHGVVPIETRECAFDPNLHEAVGQVASDGHDSDQIVEETQKGYMIGDRLLRCSKVVVAR